MRNFIAKVLHFIPCLIAYHAGRMETHFKGSPYLSGSPEDQAWHRGYNSMAGWRNV